MLSSLVKISFNSAIDKQESCGKFPPPIRSLPEKLEDKYHSAVTA
jgi:hypothetical protein